MKAAGGLIRSIRAVLVPLLALFALTGEAPSRPPAPPGENREASTARRLSALRRDPLRLRAFLREMPKGGDLHNHLSGAIYAESYLRWAAEDQLCVATATMTIVACNGTPVANFSIASNRKYRERLSMSAISS